MATKADIQDWLLEALTDLGGSAKIVAISEWVWAHYESALRESGSLFYTWQYDIRWAATKLRQRGLLKAASDCPPGVWELSGI